MEHSERLCYKVKLKSNTYGASLNLNDLLSVGPGGIHLMVLKTGSIGSELLANRELVGRQGLKGGL